MWSQGRCRVSTGREGLCLGPRVGHLLIPPAPRPPPPLPVPVALLDYLGQSGCAMSAHPRFALMHQGCEKQGREGESAGRMGCRESRAHSSPGAAVWGTVACERGHRTDPLAVGFCKGLATGSTAQGGGGGNATLSRPCALCSQEPGRHCSSIPHVPGAVRSSFRGLTQSTSKASFETHASSISILRRESLRFREPKGRVRGLTVIIWVGIQGHGPLQPLAYLSHCIRVRGAVGPGGRPSGQH